jgi:holin-like protein
VVPSAPVHQPAVGCVVSLRLRVLDRGHAVAALPLFLFQLMGLWGLNAAGVWAAATVDLPVPGNLVGMVGLYVLLSLGVVKVSWFDATGSFLIKHLAFFFIPITVGLMEWGGVLVMHGIGIAVVLIASAMVGIVLSGVISQWLMTKSSRAGNPR